MSANWHNYNQGWNQNQGWTQNQGWSQNQGWDQNQGWHQNSSNPSWNIDNNTGNSYNTTYQQHPTQPQQTQHAQATHTYPPLPPPTTMQATPTQPYTAIRAAHQTARNSPYTQQQQTPPQHQRMVHTPPTTTPTNTPHATPPTTQHSSSPNTDSNPHTASTNVQTHAPTQQTGAKYTTPHHVAIPDKWTQTTEHYDSNTNVGGPVYKQIQASAWSRRRGIHGQDPLTLPASSLLRYGCEDHAIRLLSQGKFIGLVPTRTVAESVFLSQLVKALRDHYIDLDSVAEGAHKGPNPNKQMDPIKYITPLVQCIIEEIKSKEPVQSSLEQVQKLASTEAQLAKAHQKLQQHGIQISPQRNPGNTPELPTTSQEQAQSSQQPDNTAATPAIDENQDSEPPAKKPKRARGRADKEQDKDKQDNKMDLPTILHPTSATLHDNHPSSHTDTKVSPWIDGIKDKKFQAHVKKVSDMLNNIARKDRPNLVETAIRYGAPMDKVQQMSYKSLSQVVAAGAYYAI